MMSSGSRPSQSNSSPNRGTSWEVVEIVAEEGKLYKVRWAGKDPKTGKSWPLDWVPNSHCSAELVKDWEQKKAKEHVLAALASTSTSPLTSMARKRSSENHNAAGTSVPTVRSTHKRKHSATSGSPADTDDDSAPPRRKRLAAAVEGATSGDDRGQSGAHAPSLHNRKDYPITEASPLHPPLEEIEMWVPTPSAKFGPPKRRRSVRERQDPPRDGLVDIAPSATAPAQMSRILPSFPPPSILSESQIVALREEEEESQSQSQSQLPDSLPKLNQPGSLTQSPVPTDPLQLSVDDTKGVAELSKGTPPGLLERSVGRSSVGTFPSNPNANKTDASKPDNEGVHIVPSTTNTSEQSGSVTGPPKGLSLLPTAPHISLINLIPSTNDAPPSKSSQTRKPNLPPIAKPDTDTTRQPNSSRSEPSRPGNGTLAERRAFEARLRLDELRRAGACFGGIAKWHPSASKMPQSPEHPPPHVILKQVMDGMESQITVSRDSGNEMLRSASPSRHVGADPADGPEEDLAMRSKSGQDASVRSLPQQDVVVANMLVVRGDEPSQMSSDDEVPPTASDSTQSQSHNASPQVSLSSQLASALDLLHKKSEKISELRAQVNTLRARITGGEAELMHMQAGSRGSHGREGDHSAVGVQTDRDGEALTALNAERAQWAQEKAILQDKAETLCGDKARALADVDFFREQYQRASAFASSTRSENEELLARATIAESQAINGVSMVRATFEARVSKLEGEVRKYKVLSEMLTERARRTDDDVRYRAALMPELEREFKQLHRQFGETEAELEEANDELRAKKRVNARLKRRLASLEMKERADEGTHPNRERMLWSDGEDDEEYRPPSASPGGGNNGSSPQHQGGHSPRHEDARPADGEIEQSASVIFDESAQSSNDDMVYLCRWRPDEPAGYCGVVVASKQELHEHVLSHHLSCH